MALPAAAALQSSTASRRGVRVEFYRRGDRFGHTIFVVDGEARQPLLCSCEGADDEIAPPSPPLAELHQQGDILFLTGATTLAHWSMSVEALGNRLVFDVACRWKSEVTRLGSEYLVLDTVYREALDFKLEQATLHELVSDLLRIAPSARKPTTIPATVQWQYTIASKA